MFGNKLRQARIARGYDQEALANMLGVSNSTISNWETGICLPRIRNAISICSLFPELQDSILDLVCKNDLVELLKELDEVKAERDVWRATTFDLLKEKQKWMQSSAV